MEVFLFTLGAMLLAMLGLSLGLLLRGRPLSGSCGGLAARAAGEDCPVCGRPARETTPAAYPEPRSATGRPS